MSGTRYALCSPSDHLALTACIHSRGVVSDHLVHHGPLSRLLNPLGKEGGLWLDWPKSVFKMRNLCKKVHFNLSLETTQKLLRRRIFTLQEWKEYKTALQHVYDIDPTRASTWLFNSVSATCWGSGIGQMLQTHSTEMSLVSHSDHLKWRHWCFSCS